LRKQGNKNIMFNGTPNPRIDPQMTQMDTDDKAGTDYAGLLSNGSEWVGGRVSKMSIEGVQNGER